MFFVHLNDGTYYNETTNFRSGLGAIKEELKSREWLYSKTPKFSKKLTVSLPHWLRPTNTEQMDMSLIIVCKGGLIVDILTDNKRVSLPSNSSQPSDVDISSISSQPSGVDISSNISQPSGVNISLNSSQPSGVDSDENHVPCSEIVAFLKSQLVGATYCGGIQATVEYALLRSSAQFHQTSDGRLV